MMLGILIRSYRDTHNLGVRPLAKQIGISHTSLFRFERGGRIESPQLTKIYLWALFGGRPNQPAPATNNA